VYKVTIKFFIKEIRRKNTYAGHFNLAHNIGSKQDVIRGRGTLH